MVSIFDDLEAEQDRLQDILAGLTGDQWLAPSAAAGWTVADVVLHLAQSEEAVQASVAGASVRIRPEPGARPEPSVQPAVGVQPEPGARPEPSVQPAVGVQPEPGARPEAGAPAASGVDELAGQLVEAERDAPERVFLRWQQARRPALAALRTADPRQSLDWVAVPMRPATLATTRLAEHWAHALDITGPLGIDLPDTPRLRHVAWLAHRTLPYAFAVAGRSPADGPPPEVFCDLIAPDTVTAWQFGPASAATVITGPAGEFCRVAARRLAASQSSLRATGPDAADTLRVLRTYAA